jgi:uncharacterized membrane protein YcaP (DUF421 family)
MDGTIIKKNLHENRISEEWLMQQLRHKGKQLSDIFYAVKTTNGNLVVDYYRDDLVHPLDKE